MLLGPAPSDEPLWLRYEESVRHIVESLEPNSIVEHNVEVLGRLSATQRQIDVWVQGRMIGEPILVAIECKRYSRPVNVVTVDGFIGKLLDIGADRGFLYSHSGFTASAAARARNARNPSVMPVAFKHELQVSFVTAPLRSRPSPAAPVVLSELDLSVIEMFLKGEAWRGVIDKT
ncbi:restriction endonuclease [Saccharopolyspora sp. NPDC002578]